MDGWIPRIHAAVRASGCAVVVAPPGAGKTTRVPPALAEDGPLILLQPRRVAARALARRIAEERGWTVGEEVGWQVRLERRFSARTRLLVATEGILTARLQADPLLEGWRTVVLDEFHERSIHADLALALAAQAREARADLRVVVMSATLDARRVADFLGGAPVVDVPGRAHPVAVEHLPGESVEAAVRRRLAGDGGHVLCFLPGAAEIRRAEAGLRGAADVFPLHGGLEAEAQDAALAPSTRRKVILATNIAETSLTVEGVTDVVDSGLVRVARYDAERAIDRLVTERVTSDSAEQRAGRAGRLGPGRAVRLWDPRDHLRPHREPDVQRVDLSGPVLDILAWGGDPRTFRWFEPPPPERIDAALVLLGRLEAVLDGRLTARGEAMRALPLHPRLSALLLADGSSRRAALACALLSDRTPPLAADLSSPSDLLLLAEARDIPPHVRAVADQLRAPGGRPTGGDRPVEDFLRAVLAAYPDRVARRRSRGDRRLALATGPGAVLAPTSSVREAEFLVAVELVGGERGGEALVRLASAIEPSWLGPTGREVVHSLDDDGCVRARERILYDRLVLAERPVPVVSAEAARALVGAFRARGPSPAEADLLHRITFAGLPVDVEDLVARAARGATCLRQIDLAAALPGDARQALERNAPRTLRVPSGREVPLEYRADGTVAASVKLQELFGLEETPRVGPRREPVLLLLLAPNGRPVQTTRDLAGFWHRTYPEVRRELRGRYPKHPWPEDPWTATPTHRTRRKPHTSS